MVKFGRIIPYDINISASSNNGFIVQCGCSTNTFSDKESMLNAIREYISNPEEMEKRYNESNHAPRAVCGEPGMGVTGGSMNRLRTEPVPAPTGDCCSEQCEPAPSRRY
jgi:hypothetical protein